jgi:hypothetical protein
MRNPALDNQLTLWRPPSEVVEDSRWSERHAAAGHKMLTHEQWCAYEVEDAARRGLRWEVRQQESRPKWISIWRCSNE